MNNNLKKYFPKTLCTPIIILTLFLCGLIITCYLLINPSIRKQKIRFEDIPTTTPIATPTTTFDIKTLPTTNTNNKTTCDNPTNILGVCMNYNNCCGVDNNTSVNSQCFCANSFVKDCNSKYKDCISKNSGNIESCNNILKECCNRYSNINISTNNFNKPIAAYQTADKICSLNGIANLEQRCMELCQTNTDCKAYSLITGGCNLFSTVKHTPNSNTDKSIYVIKK